MAGLGTHASPRAGAEHGASWYQEPSVSNSFEFLLLLCCESWGWVEAKCSQISLRLWLIYDSRTRAGLSLHAGSQWTELDNGVLIDCSVEVGIFQGRKTTRRHL